MFGYQPKRNAMQSLLPPPPPAMPNIRSAKQATQNLAKAATRANEAWTKDQMVDALRSVRYWLERAESVIQRSEDGTATAPIVPQPQPRAY